MLMGRTGTGRGVARVHRWRDQGRVLFSDPATEQHTNSALVDTRISYRCFEVTVQVTSLSVKREGKS